MASLGTVVRERLRRGEDLQAIRGSGGARCTPCPRLSGVRGSCAAPRDAVGESCGVRLRTRRSGVRHSHRQPEPSGQHSLRIVAPAHDRANELLARDGQARSRISRPTHCGEPLLRSWPRWAVNPRRAMYLLGHTDPNLTMRVYQHVLDLSGSAQEQLEEPLGCTVDEAFWVLAALCGIAPRSTETHSARGFPTKR